MSANSLMIALLAALALVALALRLICGPIPDLAGGDSLYAAAKYGPVPAPLAEPVEMAVSDARGGR